MRRFLPLIILLGVIFLFLFGTFKKNTRVIPTPLIGQEVPLLGLEVEFYEDFEGNNLVEILKSDKIKIINFWASWCLPCEVEHPILMGLSKKSDFIIIGVNYKDTEEGSAKFLNEKGNPYDLVVIDDEGISQSKHKNAAELISSYSGMQTRNTLDGVEGSYTTIDMRGFGEAAKSNSLILINGRILNDMDMSAVDFSSINSNSIERIDYRLGA